MVIVASSFSFGQRCFPQVLQRKKLTSNHLITSEVTSVCFVNCKQKMRVNTFSFSRIVYLSRYKEANQCPNVTNVTRLLSVYLLRVTLFQLEELCSRGSLN